MQNKTVGCCSLLQIHKYACEFCFLVINYCYSLNLNFVLFAGNTDVRDRKMSSPPDLMNDPEFDNYIKYNVCLYITKKGLERFAEERSIGLHNHIQQQFQGSIAAGRTCPGATVKWHGRWIISCCNKCQLYVDVVVKEKTNHFNFSKSNWENSYPQYWQQEPWELAKVYMNPGQPRTPTYPATPKDTDLSGILNFMDHCNFAYRDIYQPQNIKKVITMNIFPTPIYC